MSPGGGLGMRLVINIMESHQETVCYNSLFSNPYCRLYNIIWFIFLVTDGITF